MTYKHMHAYTLGWAKSYYTLATQNRIPPEQFLAVSSENTDFTKKLFNMKIFNIKCVKKKKSLY